MSWEWLVLIGVVVGLGVARYFGLFGMGGS
jgi:hypothetical protein